MLISCRLLRVSYNRFKRGNHFADPTWMTPTEITLVRESSIPREMLSEIRAKLKAAGCRRFDSLAEARRAQVLLADQDAGVISDLEYQPAYSLEVNGRKITPRKFKLDFKYIRDERVIVEDVKGHPTREWKVKWELVQALYPSIQFVIVK